MKQVFILFLFEKHCLYYAVIYNWLRNGFCSLILSFMLTGIANIRILRIICLFCFLLSRIFFICWTEMKYPLSVNVCHKTPIICRQSSKYTKNKYSG